MKKILFILTLLLVFIISCKTISNSNPPEDVVIYDGSVEESKDKENLEEADDENTAIVSEDADKIKKELYLPANTSIRYTDRGKILETNPKLIFKFVETNMPANADIVFSQLIEFMKNNPDVNIVLESHTSNKGIAYPYNYNLSVERAKLGKVYLIENGVLDRKIIESPLGESLPEYSSQNDLRRYEFIIIENDEDMIKYNTYISNLDVKKEKTYQGN